HVQYSVPEKTDRLRRVVSMDAIIDAVSVPLEEPPRKKVRIQIDKPFNGEAPSGSSEEDAAATAAAVNRDESVQQTPSLISYAAAAASAAANSEEFTQGVRELASQGAENGDKVVGGAARINEEATAAKADG